MCILKSGAVSLSVRIEIEVEVELRPEAFDVLADVFIACFLASWPSRPTRIRVGQKTRCAKKLNENV